MASENELQIVLTLIDKASAELKKITGDIKKDTSEVAKESDKANKSIQDGFKESGKELRAYRQAMLGVAAVIGSVILVSKEWAKHNIFVRDTFNEVGIAVKNTTASIGSLFAPAIVNLANLIKPLLKIINDVIKGIQDALTASAQAFGYLANFIIAFQGSLLRGSNIVEAFKIANMEANDAVREIGKQFKEAFADNIPQADAMVTKMKEMNDALNTINLQYLTGAMSAQQYYDVMTSNNIANFQNMQTQMSLMQQMAAQENLMRNQSLMDFKTDTEAKMGLLKTLQQYHHTVYSSVMDFANMAIQKISTGLGPAISAIALGTKKASEAFKEFGITLISSIIEFVVQYGVQMLIAAALSKLIMASTISQAGAIAAAWLPAAIFASIATMGAADAAGTAGISAATTSGLAIGGAAIAASQGLSQGMQIGAAIASGHAAGGWVGMNGPEIGLLGERGPEYVIPNNKLGDIGGNQTSIHIEVNNPVVRSDEDIDKLTEEISMRLAREAERL